MRILTGRAPLALLLASGVLAIGAPTALGASCYYLNGACDFGSMAANSPSAWTGNYGSDFNYMRSGGSSQSVYMTVQIRPYTGASGYSWSSSHRTTEFGRGYPWGSWQHRCYHSGPNSSISARCSFNL